MTMDEAGPGVELRLPADKGLAYQPSLVSEYTNYRPQTSVTDSVSRTQATLRAVAQRLERARVDAGDEDEEARSALDALLASVDGEFKETMGVGARRHVFGAAVKRMVQTGHHQAQGQGQDMRHGRTTTADFNEHLMDRPAALVARYYQQQAAELERLPESQRFGQYEDLERAYIDFRSKIHYVSHDVDQDLPDIRRFYADFNQDDEELMVEEAVVSYTCPLTKEYYEDPVTSAVCNHTFSRRAIDEVFNGSDSNTIKCPIPACSHYFKRSHLRPNAEIAAKAQARREREARETQQRNQAFERL
ncbi:hypothetical protein TRICI_006584 [Trichomonascus ciferrii]|uniref:SP-RING-type domain-containing protein n=1 Tax=Trichomonascus ciferrii TaxID=44093 RepID=A0A642UKC2_9ASCO|nr:hypothetical protein TRICI_006584 [Trichomonascus ciferrii]